MGPDNELFDIVNNGSWTELDDTWTTTASYDGEIPRFNEFLLAKVIVLSVMFVVAVTGNTATLVRMYRMRRRRSTINLLITHLATADLIVTFFCNFNDVVWTLTVQWLAGNAACKLIKFLQVFGLYLSTYVVVIISIDRCLAILDPISKNRAPHRVRLLLVFAWIFSAIFSLPQMYIFRVLRAPFEEEFYQCVTNGAYTARWQEQLYSMLSVLLLYLIPLATMITAYLLIFCTIARKSKDFQQDNAETLSRAGGTEVRSRLFCKAKVKSLRMTSLIVVAFVICWTPYHVVFIFLTFADSSQLEDPYVLIILFFALANSMINPLIYGAFHACSRCSDGRRDAGIKVNRARQASEPRLPPTPSSSQSTPTPNVFGFYLKRLGQRAAAAAVGPARLSGSGSRAAAVAAAGSSPVGSNGSLIKQGVNGASPGVVVGRHGRNGGPVAVQYYIQQQQQGHVVYSRTVVNNRSAVNRTPAVFALVSRSTQQRQRHALVADDVILTDLC